MIDLINADTYSDPRLKITIIDQNPDPKGQSVYEAVSNGLDALGLNIGQFGKGVKQILDWLRPTGKDRIDVFTGREGVYRQLTILQGKNGQNYIQIQTISQERFHQEMGYPTDHGTILKVTIKKAIPRRESELSSISEHSQEGMIEGIHQRFAFVSGVAISTRKSRDKKSKRVNGSQHRKIIVSSSDLPAASDSQDSPELAAEPKQVQVVFSAHSIAISDNGEGMNAKTLSKMFVPSEGEKRPPSIDKEAEFQKVKVIHDPSLPHRVSFARNQEVVVSVDIPKDLPSDATVEGGVMIEFGNFLNIPESRDSVILPVELKEKTHFLSVVERVVSEIIQSSTLTTLQKIQYINTLVVGLDGLIQGNKNNEQVIKTIRGSIIQKSISGMITQLRDEGFVLLPHDPPYRKLAIPEGKRVLYLHEKIFDWKGAIGLEEIGGEIVPEITLAGDKKLKLVVVPFTPESVRTVSRFDASLKNLKRKEDWPLIKTELFVAIPPQLGRRLNELAVKRSLQRLSEKEEQEFSDLLHLVNVFTAEEVSSYEQTNLKENVRVAPQREWTTPQSQGEIDSEAFNAFLVKPPIPETISSTPTRGIPQDADMRYVVLKNGDLIEVGTGRKVDEGVSEMQVLGNDYYLVTTEVKMISSGDSRVSGRSFPNKKLVQLKDGRMEIITQRYSEYLSVSPDKKWVVCLAEEGELEESFVFDVLSEGKYSLDDFSLLTLPPSTAVTALIELVKDREAGDWARGQAALSAQHANPQFSQDGRYLTYLEKDWRGGIWFLAVDLEKEKLIYRKEIASLLGGSFSLRADPDSIVPADIEYAMNPFASNVAYLKRKDSDALLFIDFVLGKVIPAEHLHTDSSGTYTVIVDEQNEMAVYFHESGRLVTRDSLGGGRVVLAITYWRTSGEFHAITIGTKDRVYFFDKEGRLLKKIDLTHKDADFIGNEDFYNEHFVYEDPEAWGAVWFRGDEFIIDIRGEESDPLQRLDQKGVYKHPRFNLIIDHSDPQNPVAIEPMSGKRIPYQGEILFYKQTPPVGADWMAEAAISLGELYKQTPPVGYIPESILFLNFYDRVNMRMYTYTSIGSSGRQPYVDYVPKEGITDPYWLSRYSSEDQRWMLHDDVRDRGWVFGIPEGYEVSCFDGKYFVFVNPQTGDVVYLNPENPAQPIFVSSSPTSAFLDHRPSLEQQRQQEVWKEEVLPNREKPWIEQAKRAYQPFLGIIPEEYHGDIEPVIQSQIQKLYQEQEQEIRQRFQRAIQKGGGEALDFKTPLPFDFFSARMEPIMAVLPQYLQAIQFQLRQEEGALQKSFYENLFTNLFSVAMNPQLDIPHWDEKVFQTIGLGYLLTSTEQVHSMGMIGDLCTALTEKIVPSASLVELAKIVRFLYEAGRQNPENPRIIRTQLAKMLAQPDYLQQCLSAFEKMDPEILNGYLKDPHRYYNQLGDARSFVIFLTNEVEAVPPKDQWLPQGRDILLPEGGLFLSQIVQLEQQRPKGEDDPGVMSMDYLRQKIQSDIAQTELLPPPSAAIEADIHHNIDRQSPSGANARETTQNSEDATRGMKGILEVEFYLQKNSLGEEEYVEEARDNGTGALQEVALLIPKTTKAEGEQIESRGFFGYGKFTIFEGVDRVEIITKNAQQAYLFTFTVIRDASRKIKEVRLTGIREVSDPSLAMGVTVRRIKKASNTIPELDQMLAQRSWKSFAGLAQGKIANHNDFTIYFINRKGEREPLQVEYEVLSEIEFKAVKPRETLETNFGHLRILSAQDMPLQILDKGGLRVSEIKEEYLALIPKKLRDDKKYRDHIRELEIVIQIPLPLIHSRNAFEHEKEYLPVIQKYVAIAFYQAIAYKTLTQTDPQFVFEGLPLDWETNNATHYWKAVDFGEVSVSLLNGRQFSVLQDKGIIRWGGSRWIWSFSNPDIQQEELEKPLMPTALSRQEIEQIVKVWNHTYVLLRLVNRINAGEYGKITPEELKTLLSDEERLDRIALFVKVLFLLEVVTNPEKPRESLFLRRQAIRKLRDQQAEQWRRRLEESGMRLGIPPPLESIPNASRKIAQAKYLDEATTQDLESLIVEPQTPQEMEVLELGRKHARLFGLPRVVLVSEQSIALAPFSGWQGGTIYLSRRLARTIAQGYHGVQGTLNHEMAHYLEMLMQRAKTRLDENEVYLPHQETHTTHHAVGPFAQASQYAAAVVLANHEISISEFPETQWIDSPTETTEMMSTALETQL